jgi:hypothetical protein
MKLLCVHPGASSSTHDVYVGMTEALKERGHEVWDYSLDSRIERAGAWLTYCWKRGKKALPQPTAGDIIYKASEELVARALRIHKEDAPLDCVLVCSAMYLHPDVFVLLRRAGIKVAVLFTESPYDDEQQEKLLPYVSVAWTNERISARDGVRYLPHAYRPSVHQPHPVGVYDVDDPEVPAHDVVFVGTGFKERIEMLQGVDWTGIDIGIYGDSWGLMGSRAKTRKHIRGGNVDNADVAILYRKAKIGLNLYRKSKGFGNGAPRIAAADSMNPRAYELAATGCFTLSEYRAEIPEVFGDMVPTFETPKELEALVRQWLADDVGRERVRAALPGIVSAHTWQARAAQIESDLRGAGIGASHAA